MWLCHILLIHPQLIDTLVVFHFLAVKKDAAVNTSFRVDTFSFFLGVYVGAEQLGLWPLCVTVCEERPSCFSEQLLQFTFPPAVHVGLKV